MNYKPVIVSAAESKIIKNSEVYRDTRSENEESVDTVPVYDRLRAFAEKIEIKLTEEESEELFNIADQIEELLK